MIKLELTLDQTNLVLAALGELPYKVSAEMVSEIRKQAEPQVQADQAIEEVTPDA